MPTEAELTRALEELWLQPDIVWLATRLRSDLEDERGAWPQRINIHDKFFRALLRAGCREGVPIDLVSHGKSGHAIPRSVRHRTFLEWDVEAGSTSQDGIWRAFTIFALISGDGDTRLWCWICEAVEEEDYAESVFSWWEPQSFAYARGVPLFPQRIA